MLAWVLEVGLIRWHLAYTGNAGFRLIISGHEGVIEHKKYACGCKWVLYSLEVHSFDSVNSQVLFPFKGTTDLSNLPSNPCKRISILIASSPQFCAIEIKWVEPPY